MKLIHRSFIKHILMRCVLIHHIEFIFKFNKPVSIKQLPYDSVFVTAVLIKELILKKVHLLWWFRFCHSFISYFIFFNHLQRTLNFKWLRKSFLLNFCICRLCRFCVCLTWHTIRNILLWQLNIRHNISYNRFFLHFNCNRIRHRNFCNKFF